MEYCTAERKNELLAFATAWMELESIMLSEISQALKDKYDMISPISGKYYIFYIKIQLIYKVEVFGFAYWISLAWF